MVEVTPTHEHENDARVEWRTDGAENGLQHVSLSFTQQMTQRRQLEGAAREGSHLIDALPYIDTISSEETKHVEKLIAEEMERSEKRPRDYLREMPPMPQPLFRGSVALQEAFRRVKEGQPTTPVDTHRYTLPAPPLERQNDPEAWKEALHNAQSQLEHQHLRGLNLELALKYGPELWKKANERTHRLELDYQSELTEVKDTISQINKRRKLSQMEAGSKLSKLDREWHHLVIKNAEILQACDQKRSNIEQRRAAVTSKNRTNAD